MKTSVLHTHQDHRQAPSYRWSSSHLVNQRARLRVLIYTMEHDTSIQPQPWQLSSLKKILSDLDRRIEQPGVHASNADVRSVYDEKPAIS